MAEETAHIYDCIIVGAGPGGLQAGIYLGRYNRDVLIVDRGGGRTHHAKHIENYLTQKAISGKEIIELGKEQARGFHVGIEKGEVMSVRKEENTFSVYTKEKDYAAKFALVSSGAQDNLPPELEGIHRFLGTTFFTCVDCDGYRTTGKKLAVIGNSLKTVHLAFAMKEMFTKDITVVLYFHDVPPDYKEEMEKEGIGLVMGRPVRIIGQEKMEAVEMKDGRIVPCECIMSNFGYRLNDAFLSGLQLQRDNATLKYITNRTYESSLDGLYIVGPLTGNDQVAIAAGEGAIAAIEINKRLLRI